MKIAAVVRSGLLRNDIFLCDSWFVAHDFAVHEDSRVFSVRHPYGAFGVEGVFAFGPAQTPVVPAQTRVVGRLDYGEIALGQLDPAKSVSVTHAAVQKGNPRRDTYKNRRNRQRKRNVKPGQQGRSFR